MSKGFSGIFNRPRIATFSKKLPINKIDYNRAESIDVQIVNELNIIKDHGVTIKDIPNSVNQKYNEKGDLISERYYDGNGNAYLDIDYSNHGNPNTHPIVPHQHSITIIGNIVNRDKGVRIRK